MEDSHRLSLDQASQPLSCLPLFSDMTRPQLEVVQSVLHRKHVAAGKVVISEKQTGEMAYLIVEGAVRICVRRRHQQIIIGLRGAGDVLGEMSLLDGDRRSATVITQTDCTFYWVTRSDFWNVLWPMPQFSINLTTLLTKRIRTLTSQVEGMATLSVQGRLAQLVLDLARDYGRAGTLKDAPGALEIPFRLTQADLANMIGATRVQVNQVFCRWKKCKVIRIENSRLYLLDATLLRAFVN